ncbi:MAG: TIR domain-containing protein [Chloroflexi bacterium]|nr:TIR domain-containing protein [Chloroflexota bacterium]
MTRVFISYSRTDEPFARRLATDLDGLGANIWIDVDDIPPGVNWSTAVQQGLDDCEIMLLILSPESMASENVADEWQYFHDEKKPIIPILARATDSIHFQLRRIQWIDFIEQKYDTALALLRDRLLGEIGSGEHLLPTSPAPKQQLIALGNTRRIGELRVLSGHRDSVRDVDFSPDGQFVASCSDDKNVRLWYTGRKKRIKMMIGHEKPVNAVAFSPSGAFLASGSEDRSIRLWHVGKRYCITALYGHNGAVTGVHYSPVETILASVGEDGSVRLWDAQSREAIGELGVHAAPVSDVAFSPDGTILASAGLDRTVRLWEVAERRELAVIETPDPARRLVFNPDGTLLAMGMESTGVLVYDTATHERAGTIYYTDYNSNCVRGVGFSPDGALLAIGSLDGAVRLWKSADITASKRKRAVRSLAEHEGGICGIAFSPDGALLASASHDGDVRLWGVTR